MSVGRKAEAFIEFIGEDKITALQDAINAKLDQTGAKTKAITSAQKGQEEQTGKLEQAQKRYVDAIDGAKRGWATMTVGVGATIFVAQQLLAVVGKIGSTVEGAAKSLAIEGQFGRAFVGTTGAMDRFRDSVSGRIDDTNIQRFTTRLRQAGVDADTISTALHSVVQAAEGSGADVTATLDALSLGLAKGQTRALGMLNVVVDSASAQRAYAESIGKSTTQLTEQDRAMAATMASIKAMQTAYADVSGTDSQTASIDRLKSRWSNFLDDTGRRVLGWFVLLDQAVHGEIGGDIGVTAAERYQPELQALGEATARAAREAAQYQIALTGIDPAEQKAAMAARSHTQAMEDAIQKMVAEREARNLRLTGMAEAARRLGHEAISTQLLGQRVDELGRSYASTAGAAGNLAARQRAMITSIRAAWEAITGSGQAAGAGGDENPPAKRPPKRGGSGGNADAAAMAAFRASVQRSMYSLGQDMLGTAAEIERAMQGIQRRVDLDAAGGGPGELGTPALPMPPSTGPDGRVINGILGGLGGGSMWGPVQGVNAMGNDMVAALQNATMTIGPEIDNFIGVLNKLNDAGAGPEAISQAWKKGAPGMISAVGKGAAGFIKALGPREAFLGVAELAAGIGALFTPGMQGSATGHFLSSGLHFLGAAMAGLNPPKSAGGGQGIPGGGGASALPPPKQEQSNQPIRITMVLDGPMFVDAAAAFQKLNDGLQKHVYPYMPGGGN